MSELVVPFVVTHALLMDYIIHWVAAAVVVVVFARMNTPIAAHEYNVAQRCARKNNASIMDGPVFLITI